MESSSEKIDTVLIKVASRCNINCTYCYVYNMEDDNYKYLPKQISTQTINAICNCLEQISKNQQEGFNIVLHGGEPLILGPAKLKYLFSTLRNIFSDYMKFPISIQTNGILISDDLLDLCYYYRVSISVSIDGPENENDKFRKTKNDKGSFKSVIRGIEKIKNHKNVDFLFDGLLAVVDPESNPNIIYTFFKNIQPPSIDFLYRDGNHSKLPYGKVSFETIEYGIWFSKLFDLYINDKNPIPINFFDNIIKIILGGNPEMEGYGLTDFGIIVIDTDGVVNKNDTLKSSFKYADQFNRKFNVLNDSSILDFLKSNEFREYRKSTIPSALECSKCDFLDYCGGGMVLHRWKEETKFDNPSIYCKDQKFLIEKIILTIKNILNHTNGLTYPIS